MNLQRSENFGQALEDAEEDLLRQVLGERPVAADEAEDVVVDRRLVRPDDQGKRALVTPLRLAKDTEVGLLE